MYSVRKSDLLHYNYRSVLVTMECYIDKINIFLHRKNLFASVQISFNEAALF